MIPVTLVYLPGANYLLGTFDTEDFSHWWISAGFVGVDHIVKGIQTYGEIHLAICKMTDGTWSIFQSKDYAQSWTEVFNTSYEIFDIVRINFGWTVINCGDGFYQSVNAGTDWVLVCGLPAAPVASAIANIGGGDILICTDGRYIWRSEDVAQTWAPVRIYEHYSEGIEIEGEWIDPVYHDDGDMQHIYHGNIYGQGTWPPGPQYTGPSVACLDGACGKVVVGHGPYAAWSVDGGVTFGSFWSWDYFWDTDDAMIYDDETGAWHNCFPAEAYVGGNRDNFMVTQVLISSVDGPTADDVIWLIKTDDIAPSDSNENFATPSITVVAGTYRYNLGHAPVFESTGNTVRAIDKLGRLAKNYTVVYSSPPGADEAYIDTITGLVTVGSIAGKTLETRIKVNNSGLWSRVFRSYNGHTSDGTQFDNHWIKYEFGQRQVDGVTAPRMASYELLQAGADAIDRLVFIVQSTYDPTLEKFIPSLRYSTDGGIIWTSLDPSQFTTEQGALPVGGGPFLDDNSARLTWVSGYCNNWGYWDFETGGLTRNMSYDMDFLKDAGEEKPVTYDFDVYIEGTETAIYKLRSRIEATHTGTMDADGVIVADHTATMDADVILEKVMKAIYRAKGWVSGPDVATYQMGALVYSSNFPQINMPQAYRLEFPWIAESGYPYDSREA